MRLDSDLAQLLYDASNKNLKKWTNKIAWSDQQAFCVIMATQGYPASYPKDTAIYGLDKITENETQKIFHAGTKQDGDQWLSTGGRVLAVTTLCDTLKLSKEKTYGIIGAVTWDKGFYRSDIGWRALKNS